MTIEEEVAFKKLRKALRKITSLKYAKKTLNSEIRKQEEEVERIQRQYPKEKIEEYMKKLKEYLDELEEDHE